MGIVGEAGGINRSVKPQHAIPIRTMSPSSKAKQLLLEA